MIVDLQSLSRPDSTGLHTLTSKWSASEKCVASLDLKQARERPCDLRGSLELTDTRQTLSLGADDNMKEVLQCSTMNAIYASTC